MKTLKELVKESGKSREEIAVACKCSKQTIDNWCWGHNKPNAESCRILAGIFGITTDEMIAVAIAENSQ